MSDVFGQWLELFPCPPSTDGADFRCGKFLVFQLASCSDGAKGIAITVCTLSYVIAGQNCPTARDAEAAAAKDSPALGTASDASRSAKLSFSYRMRFLLPSFLHACFDRKDIVFAAGADR